MSLLGVLLKEGVKKSVVEQKNFILENKEGQVLESKESKEMIQKKEVLEPCVEKIKADSLESICAENKEYRDIAENIDEDVLDIEAEDETERCQDTIDGIVYYYDDNGNLYRVGNDLVPNSEYEINGYKYTTDDQGRIVSAEGTLHMKDREGRLPIKDSIEDIGKGDQKEGDDRGHLIGDQFDGSNGLENMVPQDANINRNDFKNFEISLADEVKSGKEVTVKIEPIYEGDSRRPEAIGVTYSIDGEESIRVFPNGREE